MLFNTGAFASVSLHATGDLGVSPSHADWMQSCLALVLPVSSWLAAAVDEVRLYLPALVAMTLAWALLFDRHSPQRKMPFDGVGFLLSAAALLCLQTVLNQGQDADWYNSN